MQYYGGESVRIGDTCQSGWAGTCRVVRVNRHGQACLENMRNKRNFTIPVEDGMREFDLIDREEKRHAAL